MSNTSTGKSLMVQGRIVWVSGDLFKGRPQTDQQTRQPIIDPKTGLQKIQYGFGLAIPKDQMQQGGAGYALYLAGYEQAYEIYPSRQLPADFATKMKDGDTGLAPDGSPLSARKGHAGHCIFAMTTSLPIKFYVWEQGQNGAPAGNVQKDSGIKCGDYVNVQVSVVAHGAVNRGKAGLYLNPQMVQLVRIGEEIVNAPSGDQVFGAVAPAGMDYTLVPPNGMLQAPAQQQFQAPPMPGQAQAQYQQQPAYAGQPAQQPPVQPHYQVLPQQYQQPAQPVAPPAFMPPGQFPQNGYQAPPPPQQQFAPPPAGYAAPQVAPQGAPFAQPAYPNAMPQFVQQPTQGFPSNQQPGMPPMPPGYAPR